MNNFRKSFGLATKHNLNWFPKHMNSGLKQMQAKLRSVDCILEVHDSRIPLSGRNPYLCRQLVGHKPHILVMNKSDLISNEDKSTIRRLFAKTVSHIIFTNSKTDQDPGIRKLVPTMKDLIENSDRFHRSHTREYHAMIIGIPNVGKSSLINMLRSKHLKKGRALKVGPSAGVTKCVHEKVRISENPIIFLFDTPGILEPRVSSVENGMKLAACGNLPESQVGNLVIADYILYALNSMGSFRYIHFAGLKEPSDCILSVLASAAARLKFVLEVRSAETGLHECKPDLNRTAEHFIHAFRRGQFGRVVLDQLESRVFDFEHSYENSASRRNYSDLEKDEVAPVDLNLPIGTEDDVKSSLINQAQS